MTTLRNHTYGEPCFQDNSARSITIVYDDLMWKLFYKCLLVQGMKYGIANDVADAIEQAENALVDVYTEYKSRMCKADKMLFKNYFENNQ